MLAQALRRLRPPPVARVACVVAPAPRSARWRERTHNWRSAGARPSSVGSCSALLLVGGAAVVVFGATCAAEPDRGQPGADPDRELSIGEVRRRLKLHREAVAGERISQSAEPIRVEEIRGGGGGPAVRVSFSCPRDADVTRVLGQAMLAAGHLGHGPAAVSMSDGFGTASVQLTFGGGEGGGGGEGATRECRVSIRRDALGGAVEQRPQGSTVSVELYAEGGSLTGRELGLLESLYDAAHGLRVRRTSREL
eukprot:tig00021603_g22813.t1